MPNGVITGWQAAAAFTGRSIAAIRRAVAAGQLPASRDEEGRHVFAREDLEALRVERATQGNGAASWDARPGTPPPALPAVRGFAAPQLDEFELAIFADLARGADPGDVALVHGVDPDWLRRRAAAWKRLTAIDSSSQVSRVERIESDVAMLLDENRRLLERIEVLEHEHALLVELLAVLRRR
jgi:hypothetical protein